MNKRKYFGSITTKTYIGKKSINVHLPYGNMSNTVKLVRLIIHAIENKFDIDLTVLSGKLSKKGNTQIIISGVPSK